MCRAPCRNRRWRPSCPEHLSPTGEVGVQLPQLAADDDEVQEVSLLDQDLRLGDLRLAESRDGGHEDPTGNVQVADLGTGGGVGHLDPDGHDRTGANRAEDGLRWRHHPREHLVGGPCDGGNGGYAEALVDLGSAGVVYPGGDVPPAVVLLGDPGADDVGVVAVGHRDEDVGLLDAGLLEDVPVEARSDERLAVKALVEMLEGGGVLVDDGHGEVALRQGVRQLGAHPSTAHDDGVHERNDTRRPANFYASQIDGAVFLTKSIRAKG